MSRQSAHNDNARDYAIQKIDDLTSLLRWYREAVLAIDPTLTQADRRCLMFAVARCVTGYQGEIDQCKGILLQLSQHFGGGQ